MFRFINAWLQAMFRYFTAWLQSAAADEPDAASLQGTAAMDFPVTVSLGPLHRQLRSSFKAGKNKLPDGVSEGEIQRLQEDLEIVFTELKIVSEADDPSFTAKCWMKEVRELRYDTEDFLDEVLRPCAGGGDGTRRSALLTIILWIPSKLKRRRQVAKAFSDLWARVKDGIQRRQSFQLGPAIIRPEFGQGNASRCSRGDLPIQVLEESMDNLVNRLALPEEEIVELLAFDTQDAEEQVHVVPIFGFAGVGKTTLARTFYRNFGGKFQCRAFVRVSRNPDMRMLLSSMLSQIKAPPVHGFSDVQDLLDKVREYLQRKRYLIVIDDLWASSTWDIIRCALPDGDCCSRIIVTTEIEDVALACCRYQFKYMYEMGPLNGEQSRNLFLDRAFGSENDCAPDFKEVTDEIIQKCGGLPLATENIASMLACELNVEQWKHIRDSLPSILSLRTYPRPEGLKEVLNIIYNNLSPKLKTCLLYLIMYPEGYTITKDELVKQWVVEDFIGEEQDREKTAEGYFDELVSRGMIQPVDRNYNDEVLTCTVHHMVLDLIRYKSLEENFIITVSCSQTTPGLPDKVRRLSVQFSGAKCANIPADFMITQARSLIFFGFLNCVPSILECKILRVLTLHIWADQSKIFDLTRITELFQLRYLRINCNITVHLPDGIQQLKFLETLEIHAPVNNMPSDISCLPVLRTLGYFDLSKNSIENVQNLGKLNNLHELHLTWSNTAEPDNLKNNMQCLGSILWKLSNLKSLTLVPATSYHADDLDDTGAASMGISGDVLSSASSPLALLERLELSGSCLFSSLPEWIKELEKLCILKIAVRKLLRKDIDILKGLPALRALSLYVWTAPVGKVVFDNEGFSVLKYFKFICAAPSVVFLKGSMPSVRELKLAFSANGMEQYSQVVDGLEYLTELKEITVKVWGTGADESVKRYAESVLSGAIAKHPCTPIIRVQYIDRILYGEEDTSATREEHWTLEKQHKIQEELLDCLPELISTPSTQTQMRDRGQNEGTDRSIEVLTQEQEHWTLKDRGIQEELLDPVPECLSTPITAAQTRDGVLTEQIEGSKDVLTHKLEHWTLETEHEIQEELLDPLPEDLSTPRSREVLTQEQEHWTLVKQHKIQEELLDPLPTQTQTRDGVQGELIKRCSPENFGSSYTYSNHVGLCTSQPDHTEKLITRQASMDLATGAMGSLLPKLVQLLGGEYRLQMGIQGHIRSLEGELRIMHTALRKVADVQRDQLDELVKIWANEVRDLSYDMEDVVDSFLLHVQGFEPDTNSHKLKRLVKKMRDLLTKGKTRHKIADEIKDIKVRVKEVADRRDRYRGDSIVANPAAATAIDPRLLMLYKQNQEIVGAEEARDELIEKLTGGDVVSKNQLKVLSIFGFGGLGKTTLAKEVYDRLQAQYACKAFVVVGRNHDPKKVLKDILLEIDKQKYMDFNLVTLDERQLIDELREQLVNKRYFIVIDDIWDINTWEIIRCAFMDSDRGSRIITTTQIFEIAIKAREVYRIKPLSHEKSEELFYTRLSGDKSKCNYDQQIELSEKILRKCGGVPLAIIAIASLLASKPMDDWSKVYNSIGFGSGHNEDVENTRKILLYSYYDMPSYLRTCLLHLSIYPEDDQIEKVELIWKWVAEGFVHEEQDMRPFEVGERYFNELINRRMIHPFSIRHHGPVFGCYVHDMVLDMIRYLSKEENFVSILGSDEQRTSLQGNIRRLAIQNGAIDKHGPLANTHTQQLRSFNATSCVIGAMLPLENFRALRVLDFYWCRYLDEHSYHLEHLGKLLQLRYLGLQGTPITELPEEIGDLRSLQTLDISLAMIRELPLGVSLLRQLKCLHMLYSAKVPEWIGNLTSLEDLALDDVSEHPNCVKELGKLTELRRLRIGKLGAESCKCKAFVESLDKLQKIQELQITSAEGANLETHVPSRQLRDLCLETNSSRLPMWINFSLVPNLTYLFVTLKIVKEQDVLILGMLPELLTMRLIVAISEGGYSSPCECSGGAFPKLKLCDTPTPLLALKGAMPSVEFVRFEVHVRSLMDSNFDFDFSSLGNLSLLEKAMVEIYCTGATAREVEAVEAAVWRAVQVHPNRPFLDLERRGEDIPVSTMSRET